MAGIITKYRPKQYKDVLGQEAAVSAMRGLEKEKPSGILISGPSGVGKTTLARIFAARMIGCNYDSLKHNLDCTEVNVGSEGGIDKARKLIENSEYHPFGKVKIIIMDEIQKLTSAAINALLKPLEDPPPNVIWILCSSEPKLPIAILNRLSKVTLDYVEVKELETILLTTCKKEKQKLPKKVIRKIADLSLGSPRDALSNLSIVLAKIRGKSKDAASLKLVIKKHLNQDVLNVEKYALHLLGNYYLREEEKFVALLLGVDLANSNHLCRLMANFNEYLIFKKVKQHKKIYCGDYPTLNKLVALATKESIPIGQLIKTQIKLTALINVYPLLPLTIHTIWE